MIPYTKIITHGPVSNTENKAHLDDFLASCVAIANNPSATFERKDMVDLTQEELNDPNILILDMGGVFNPSLNNFDHHMDEKMDCGFVLFMDSIGMKEKLFESFAWARTVNYNDIGGMERVAEKLGFPTDQKTQGKLGSIFSNPLSQFALRNFSKISTLNPTDSEYLYLKSIGDWILDECKRCGEAYEAFEQFCTFETIEIGENKYIYCDQRNLPDDSLSHFFGGWANRKGIVLDFIVANSGRAKGCVNIVRRNNCLDFRKYQAKFPEKVNFCHANGFLISLIDFNLQEVIDNSI